MGMIFYKFAGPAQRASWTNVLKICRRLATPGEVDVSGKSHGLQVQGGAGGGGSRRVPRHLDAVHVVVVALHPGDVVEERLGQGEETDRRRRRVDDKEAADKNGR